MIFFFNKTIKDIPISKIDLTNRYFKVSRNYISEKLSKSVNCPGLIEPVILKKSNNKYIIIFGHNRIEILSRSDKRSITSIVLDDITRDHFQSIVLLKIYRNEIGPIGKIRYLTILRDYFQVLENDLKKEIKKHLELSENIILKSDTIKEVLSLPEAIIDYIDIKDISFKLIFRIIKFPEDILLLLSSWIKIAPIRINYFKKIVDYLFDIYKRDGNLNKIMEQVTEVFNDGKEFEEYIFKKVSQVRYPEYSSIKGEAENIIHNISNKNVKIGFPQYFENDYLELILRVSKYDDLEKIGSEIERLTGDEQFRKLLFML